ncbi:MAG: hypothetical protein ISP86_00930 [Shewanellaceae bacterium]|nr:hypothetical protein [Shewanellaceae bacterium]
MITLPAIAVPLTDPTQPWLSKQVSPQVSVVAPDEVWRLQAVQQTQDGAVAIINNTLVRVGETIAGSRIEKIEHQSVYLANGRVLKVFAVTQSS